MVVGGRFTHHLPAWLILQFPHAILAQAASVQLGLEVCENCSGVWCFLMGTELILGTPATLSSAGFNPQWVLCGLLVICWVWGCACGLCFGCLGRCPNGVRRAKLQQVSPPRPSVRDFPFSPKQD